MDLSVNKSCIRNIPDRDREGQRITPDQIRNFTDGYITPSDPLRSLVISDANIWRNYDTFVKSHHITIRKEIENEEQYPIERHNEIVALEIELFGIHSCLRLSDITLRALHSNTADLYNSSKTVKELNTALEPEKVEKALLEDKEGFIAYSLWLLSEPVPDLGKLKDFYKHSITANKKQFVDYQENDWRIRGVDKAITLIADKIFELENPTRYFEIAALIERKTGITRKNAISLPGMQKAFTEFMGRIGSQTNFQHYLAKFNIIPDIKTPSSVRFASTEEITKLHDLFRARIYAPIDTFKDIVAELDLAIATKYAKRLSKFTHKKRLFSIEKSIKEFVLDKEHEVLTIVNKQVFKNGTDAIDELGAINARDTGNTIHAGMIFIHITEIATGRICEIQLLARENAHLNAAMLRVHAIRKNPS